MPTPPRTDAQHLEVLALTNNPKYSSLADEAFSGNSYAFRPCGEHRIDDLALFGI